jgi:hypothetical protein
MVGISQQLDLPPAHSGNMNHVSAPLLCSSVLRPQKSRMCAITCAYEPDAVLLLIVLVLQEPAVERLRAATIHATRKRGDLHSPNSYIT